MMLQAGATFGMATLVEKVGVCLPFIALTVESAVSRNKWHSFPNILVRRFFYVRKTALQACKRLSDQFQCSSSRLLFTG